MALIDVPLSGQTLNDTRNPIRNNFLTINTAFLVNHAEYNTADQGKHTWVTFQQQTTPSPFVDGEVGLSNYQLALTGTRELWITLFNSAGTKFEYPISSSILSTIPNPSFGSSGFGYLPSGILLKWGRATGLINGGNIISLDTGTATGGRRFGNIINVQLTPISGTNPTVTFLSSDTVSTPQTITINVQNSTAVLYFIIGTE